MIAQTSAYALESSFEEWKLRAQRAHTDAIQALESSFEEWKHWIEAHRVVYDHLLNLPLRNGNPDVRHAAPQALRS